MSQEKLNVFPSRMNYKALETNLLGSKRGFILLKAKNDVLTQKYKIIDSLFNKNTDEAFNLFKAAFLMLAKAEYYEGNLESFISENSYSVSINTNIENFCGLILPLFNVVKPNKSNSDLRFKAGTLFEEAKQAFISLIDFFINIVTMSNSHKLIKSSIEIINRRMKALEHIIIPRFENTLKFISSELDEQERDDFYRLKKIQKGKIFKKFFENFTHMIAKNLTIKQRYHYIAKENTDSLELAGKNQKYPRNIYNNLTNAKSAPLIIKYAMKTEKAVKIMERFNTLTFVVDIKATKPEIKAAVQELFGCKVAKVNTLNLFKQYAKKAFVRFAKDGDAVEIASKAGVL